MTNILQKQRGGLYTASSAGAVGPGRSYMASGGSELPIASGPLQPFSAVGGRRSLNREARKRELMKITKENQLILKRL